MIVLICIFVINIYSNIYNQKDIIEIILVDSELSPKREIGGIAQLNIDTFND